MATTNGDVERILCVVFSYVHFKTYYAEHALYLLNPQSADEERRQVDFISNEIDFPDDRSGPHGKHTYVRGCTQFQAFFGMTRYRIVEKWSFRWTSLLLARIDNDLCSLDTVLSHLDCEHLYAE